MIIQDTKTLDAVCRRFAAHPFMTVDTEFIREKTYYPVLCLIQIASPDEAFCIDPLAPDLDLTPLFRLFQDTNVVKVFHACRQDIEIFYQLSGQIPTPLFDTQIAAMVCGFIENIAYQKVVQEITGVQLDKTMRYTDWHCRPLDDKQISYALCDVTYLRDVYRRLAQDIQQKNRSGWLAEEMAPLTNPDFYQVNPQTVWEKIKSPFHQKRAIQVFAQVCAWRENKARKKNRPRRHILKDEALVELAALCPTSVQALAKMRSLPSGFATSDSGLELVRLIGDVLKNPDTYPIVSTRDDKKVLTSAQRILADLIRLLVDVIAEKNGVASKILATSDDIQDIVLDVPTARCLNGWRYDIVGQPACLLKQGKLIFTYNPKCGRIDIQSLD